MTADLVETAQNHVIEDVGFRGIGRGGSVGCDAAFQSL